MVDLVPNVFDLFDSFESRMSVFLWFGKALEVLDRSERLRGRMPPMFVKNAAEIRELWECKGSERSDEAQRGSLAGACCKCEWSLDKKILPYAKRDGDRPLLLDGSASRAAELCASCPTNQGGRGFRM